MSDEPEAMTEGPPNAGVAEAVVEKRSRPSAVWLIPVVAALIGAFLVYKTFAERGPTVTIHFKTAAGLEAGKTKIKYKDVDIGLVQSIQLTDDFSGVVVTAELVKNARPYLTENTRFWVVRAQVSAGRVTGLGTLFSGAYIGMEPSTAGERSREFVGLEVQPIVTSDDPGRRFQLRSPTGGTFEIGAPVYFRRIQVGEVISSQLSESGDHVMVQIFVRAPHDKRVSNDTRFWNASGLDFSLDADGIRVDTASFTSLLVGGVSFETAANLEEGGGEPAADHVFHLYPNRTEAFSETYTVKRNFVLKFEQSVEGLRVGAPVLFQGIRIGKVLDVRLEFKPESLRFVVPVLIELEPERVTPRDQIPEDPADNVKALIEAGLRARLESGNLITGSKQIELVMIENAAPAKAEKVGRFFEIPTVPTPLEALASNLANIVAKLDKLPIEEIGEKLNGSLGRLEATLANVEDLTAKLDAEVMPNVAAVSRDASALLSPNSPVTTELRQLLIELTEAARSLRLMADYLEQHPESLVRGKKE